jgi:hypothetical protein
MRKEEEKRSEANEMMNECAMKIRVSLSLTQAGLRRAFVEGEQKRFAHQVVRL